MDVALLQIDQSTKYQNLKSISFRLGKIQTPKVRYSSKRLARKCRPSKKPLYKKTKKDSLNLLGEYGEYIDVEIQSDGNGETEIRKQTITFAENLTKSMWYLQIKKLQRSENLMKIEE